MKTEDNEPKKPLNSYALEKAALWETLSFFQYKLLTELEKDRLEYTQKRDTWKISSPNYETYDLAVRICDQYITLVKTLKP